MNSNSPFNWQGKPSIFSSSREHNGINTRTSERAKLTAKNTIKLKGSDTRSQKIKPLQNQK